MRNLHRDGAKIFVADVNAKAIAHAESAYGATPIAPDAILNCDCDIFSPNALGGVLTGQSLETMTAKLVCGAANNQIVDEQDADIMHDRGITWIPDFITNTGGSYGASAMINDLSQNWLETKLRLIGELTTKTLARAEREQTSPYQAAIATAKTLLASEQAA